MPNCPVCGKEVQASTQYCPACGASIQQPGFGSSPIPNYSTVSSYPQSLKGTPSATPPHTHAKYIIAIIALFIIGLVVGGLVTSAFLIPPDVTDVTGTVTLNGQYVTQYHGVPNRILFGNTSTGNLSSAIFSDNSYQAYLPVSNAYTVLIQWTNITGSTFTAHTCTAVPSTFSSSNSNATANFSC